MSQPRQTPADWAGPSGPPVRLVTLGEVRFEPAGVELPGGMASGRPLALLVYLAMHAGRACTRDELADLLWGDRDLKAGRRVLRQALYVIRKGLGAGAVATDGERVRFQGALALDVREAEAALRDGDPARALELFVGRFLEGMEIAGASAFRDWVDQERARILGLFREATLTCARAAVAAGDPRSALAHVERYLAFAPHDAPVAAVRAECLDLLGRRVEAAAAARQVLQALEADPSAHVASPALPTLRRLAALNSGEGGGTLESTSQSGLAPPAFIGRDDELLALRTQWRGCVRGEGRVVLVVGDPGVGKTRLIEELLRDAAPDEPTVLRGKSYELEDGLLFGALVEVMAQAVKAPGFAAVSDAWLRELARLLPELLDQYPRLARATDGDAGVGRRRFHEAVAQVLEALAYEAPVICVLDDLHWADEATLELVHYLTRRLCAAPVLLIAGLRLRQASETLLRLKQTLVEEHGGVAMELAALERAPLGEVVASMGHGHPPPPELDQAVWEASGGNPFLAVSTVRALVDEGVVRVSDAGWTRPAGEGPPPPMPEAWQLVKARLEGLPPHTREILELAAIVGRRFTADMLCVPPSEDVASARVHLDAMEARRILRSDRSNGVVYYDFAHDRLREAVYEGIPPKRRAELHARVARGSAGDSGLSACILARHFHQAGNRDETYRHALLGAEWARGVFAYGGELEMLELARANAPDEGTAVALDGRLEALRSRAPAVLAPHRRPAGVRPRRSAWRWVGGAAAALVVGSGGLAIWGAGAEPPAPSPLPPLPEGLLVSVGEGGGRYFAVLDPDDPQRTPVRLEPSQLTLTSRAVEGPIPISPDGRWLAVTIAEGAPPDVWIQRRDGAELRRVTDHPEDDIPLAWLPDGSGLLVRTFRDRSGATYGASLAVAPVDGSEVRIVTRGPWSDRVAAMSPDGSRIAVARELDGVSLWIMDADGTGGGQLLAGLGAVAWMAWSPSGGALAFVESGDEGARLVVLDLGEPAPSPRVVATRVREGPFWSPAGETLYYTAEADNNAEIFSVPRAGGAPRRLTHTAGDERLLALLAPPKPYAAAVEILPAQGGEALSILEGDSVRLSALTWSSEGRLMEGFAPVLRCLDPGVCGVDESGQVVGRGPGHTHLVADLGGWRADTVEVRVVDGAPSLVLAEDWERGLDSESWMSFGEPRPSVVEGVGRDGTRGWLSNGDAKFSSGVVGTTALPWRDGIALEFWARGAFDTPAGSHQGWGVGFTTDAPPDVPGDVAVGEMGSVGVGSGTPDRRPALTFQGRTLSPSSSWDPAAWHRYTLQLLPDARCELWIDGVRRFQEPCGVPTREHVRVVLRGRATHAPVVLDDVEVWTGVRRR